MFLKWTLDSAKVGDYEEFIKGQKKMILSRVTCYQVAGGTPGGKKNCYFA